MSKAITADNLTNKLTWAVIAILVLLPFHALLTTWAGSNLGHLDAWRIWKEIIIFALVPVSLWLAYKTPTIRTWLRNGWLPRLLFVYLLLHLALGVWALVANNVNSSALIYGLFANLRFLGFFAICLVIANRHPSLQKYWWKILLLPAVVVVLFGLIQPFLPIDFLRHFGYSPNTIPAFQSIDQKLDYQRIQSTLRGANSLGAYLILIVTALMAYGSRRRWLKYGFITASLVVLFFSYSRSAWLGAIAAVGFYLILQHRRWWSKRIWLIAVIMTGVLTLSGLLLYTHRHNDRLENTLFHTDETSESLKSSNASRLSALKGGVTDLFIEPFGRGPGTAGPASTRNDNRARIAENYYLQIAQETGWLGLGLFLAINVMVGWSLWQNRREQINMVLLASLAGLSVVNLVSHAWADDTLGLLFWGLTGIALAPAILNKKRKTNGKSSGSGNK
jgi:hypothetical protein